MPTLKDQPVESIERQSTDLEEIQAALWEQSFSKCGIKVSCGMDQEVAVARGKGHLRAMFRGW